VFEHLQTEEAGAVERFAQQTCVSAARREPVCIPQNHRPDREQLPSGSGTACESEALGYA